MAIENFFFLTLLKEVRILKKLEYTDLLRNVDNNYLQHQTKVMQTKLGKPLDLSDENDKWLAVSYVYALNKGLREYQARSFASELTLFLTKKLYDTDVYFVYREEELDAHFYKEHIALSQKYFSNDKEFYLQFIAYMIYFYKSEESWKYERVSKYLQFKVSSLEKEMYNSIPMKPKQTFIHLLHIFDYDLKEFEYTRKSYDLDTTCSINLTPSEYYQFMQVLGSTKTDKFLNLLYFYYKG